MGRFASDRDAIVCLAGQEGKNDGGSLADSREHFVAHSSVHVGQPKVTTLKAIGQLRVVAPSDRTVSGPVFAQGRAAKLRAANHQRIGQEAALVVVQARTETMRRYAISFDNAGANAQPRCYG